jgi:hypothetical protein
MTSLHRLIAIILIWVITGGVLVSIFNMAFLASLNTIGILLMTGIVMAGAAYATGAVASATTPPEEQREQREQREQPEVQQ